MKAPTIRHHAILSARLVLNTWQNLVALLYSIILSTSNTLFMSNSDQYSDGIIKTFLIHKPGMSMVLPTKDQDSTGLNVYVNGTLVSPYKDEIVDSMRFVYFAIDDALPSYTVRVTASSLVGSVGTPFEKKDSETTYKPLEDFNAGTPTIEQWNDVSSAINEQIDSRTKVYNHSPFSVRNLVDAQFNWPRHIFGAQKHRTNDLIATMKVHWPVHLFDEIGGNHRLASAGIKFYATTHSGTTVAFDAISSSPITAQFVANAGDVLDIEVMNKMYMQVGDKIGDIRYNDVFGTITAINGNVLTISFEKSVTKIIYSILSTIPVASKSHSVETNSNTNLKEGAFEWKPKLPVSAIPYGQMCFWNVDWDIEVHQGDTYDYSIILEFAGEIGNNMNSDMLPMQPFDKGDPVPGNGAKSINTIIQNIRLIQSKENWNFGAEHLSSNRILNYTIKNIHPTLAFKLDYETSGDDVTIKQPYVMFYDGIEWKRQNIKYDSSAIDTVQYMDIYSCCNAIAATMFYEVYDVKHAIETHL